MSRISVKRTVFFDKETGDLCSCEGNFWKTCSLRVINQLPCKESIISITPIDREGKDSADSSVRAIDQKLSDLTDTLRNLDKKLKI